MPDPGAEPAAKRDRGQGGIEYVGLTAVATAIVVTLIATDLGGEISQRYCEAVQTVASEGSGPGCRSNEAGGGDEDSGDPGKDDPDDDPFHPEKCLLSSEETKDTVVVQVLFIKISKSEQVKVQQWSDGTATMERVGSTGGGVTGNLGVSIGKLKGWGGGATLGGSYVKSSGSGGQWMFNAHKSGDKQKDLEANYEDAKQFAEYLKKAEECKNKSGPRAAELGMICSYHADKDKPDVDPEKAPDVDITKTTTDKSGDVTFGGSYAKNDKGVKKIKDQVADRVRKQNPGLKGKALDKKIQEAQSKSVIGNTPETKDVGNLSTQGLSGAMSDDVVVMRHKTGEDAGKITFVYTFSRNGKVGEGYQAGGSHMQQVAVTYDAKTYDEDEKEDRPHRPEKLSITTSQESSGGEGVNVGAGANAGPVTIDVGGGGGSTETDLHTQSAELKLENDDDAAAVEEWLRDGGDNPENGLPSPEDAADALPENPTEIQRLLHDKAKVTSLDYKVNTDWWNASLGIGFGLSSGSLNTGFKLFGVDITHEERNQKITGDPQYAGAPDKDGERPWKPFTNCTDVKPV
ncbi:hypothetical protein [Streptomyces sp. NPDC005438]|uniref:hypothetical protein n=1 Tax=Streptomyces sp. NPDC005438 TaxID=3156880 RepID=UPI0033BEB55E